MLAVLCLFVVCRPKLLVLRSSCCLFASVLQLARRGRLLRSAGEGAWRDVWRRRISLLVYAHPGGGRARSFGRRYGSATRMGYLPFFFSARFSFSTSEVPGSPPSTNLARQAFGQRCHARMASATRVDFFFGGVDALAVSFFILEAAAAMASMVGAGAQGRRAARNGPRGCQI